MDLETRSLAYRNTDITIVNYNWIVLKLDHKPTESYRSGNWIISIQKHRYHYSELELKCFETGS